jgi:hypothetical protein
MPYLSIVIPTCNRIDKLERNVFQHLMRQCYLRGLRDGLLALPGTKNCEMQG